MTSLSELRDGLKTRLETVSGLRAHDTWPGQVNPPAVLVKPGPWRWLTMDSTTKVWTFELTLAVQLGSLAKAQDALDAYASDTGASSIEAALLGDDTLGGKADGILNVAMHDYGVVSIADVDYLGCVFDVEVMA